MAEEFDASMFDEPMEDDDDDDASPADASQAIASQAIASQAIASQAIASPSAPEFPIIDDEDEDERPIVKKRLRKQKSTGSKFIADVTVGRAEKSSRGEDFTDLRPLLQKRYKRLSALDKTGWTYEQQQDNDAELARITNEIAELDQAELDLAAIEKAEREDDDDDDDGNVSSDEDEDALDVKNDDDIKWETERIVQDDDEEVVRNHKRVHKKLARKFHKEEHHTDASALLAPTDRRAVLSRAIASNTEGDLAKALEGYEKHSKRTGSLGKTTYLDALPEAERDSVTRLIEIVLKNSRFEFGEVTDDAEDNLDARITYEHRAVYAKMFEGRALVDRMCEFYKRASDLLQEQPGALDSQKQTLAALGHMNVYYVFVTDVVNDVYRSPQTDIDRGEYSTLDIIGMEWRIEIVVPRNVKPETAKKFVNAFDNKPINPGQTAWSLTRGSNGREMFVSGEYQCNRLRRFSRVWLGFHLIVAMIEKVLSAEDVTKSVRSSYDRSLKRLMRNTYLVDAAREILIGAGEAAQIVKYVEDALLADKSQLII